MRRSWMVTIGLWSIAFTAACGELDAREDKTSNQSQEIVNGQPDTIRRNVGHFVIVLADGTRMPYSSGSLISPDYFLCAAHSIDAVNQELAANPGATAWVSFDDVLGPASVLHAIDEVHVHPGWTGSFFPFEPAHDQAVVRLSAPVVGVTPVRLPSQGLLDSLKASQQLTSSTTTTIVGYGGYPVGPGASDKWANLAGAGTRRSGTMHYQSLRPSWVLTKALGNDSVGCLFDSGSPLLVAVNNQEVAVGTLSWLESYACVSHVWYNRLDTPGAREFLDDFVVLP
jgi:hypothetical protein